MKKVFALIACGTLLAAPGLHLWDGPSTRVALDHISADSLRGHLSFIASDALEGRNTPSRGLDIAAEYIAAQFRRAGLEGPVDGGYFQTADFLQLTRQTEGFSLTLESRDQKTLDLDGADASVIRGDSAIDLLSAPLYKLAQGASLPVDLSGQAVFVQGRLGMELMRTLKQKNPAVVFMTGGRRGARPSHELVPADRAEIADVPYVSVHGDSAVKFLDALPDGVTRASVSLHSLASRREAVKLRNVIGLLRGSDAQLRETYIIVSAHYDHMGMKDSGDGDRIYNGANDDGSGTVSVIELASALASMPTRPKRSIVFMTVFGEEEGLLGSQYYALHPVFPLRETVADINLEQIGRTDDSDGPQVSSATITGFTYSDLPSLFAQAGNATGVKVYDRNTGDDPFFARSDNQALADCGIPSHTVAVALEFPDYHEVGDEWHKIDYNNMTRIDRMLGLGIISLANNPQAPTWNEANHHATRYLSAQKKLLSNP